MKKRQWPQVLAVFLLMTAIVSVLVLPVSARSSFKHWNAHIASIGKPAHEASPVYDRSFPTAIPGTRKKTILIGDSRTANLRQLQKDSYLVRTLFQQDGDILWDFQWGAKFEELTTNLVPLLELHDTNLIDNQRTIVLWMGYNDTDDQPSASVREYIAYYNLMAMTWIARGAKVYVLNVGPGGRMPGSTEAEQQHFQARNRSITAFNAALHRGLLPQVHYLDCYRYLKDNGYHTVDGTHYDSDTSRKLYRYLLNKTK